LKHPQKDKHLEEIWKQVPVDYYQKGVSSNILQRIWHVNKLKQVTDAIRSVNKYPKNILDVGCASGWFLSKLEKEFPKTTCVGVDIYKDAVTYGKSHYKNISFYCADAHKLPFKNKTFDIIVCCEVLEHVVNVDQVLREMKRVIKPTGKIIVEIDSGNTLFKLIWFWWTNLRHGVWRDAHLHMFNIRILENLFIKNGFKVKKKKIFNITMAVIFLLTL
jgi:ubiquinone/menaquinone biosynthesis C-methylase UbiE